MTPYTVVACIVGLGLGLWLKRNIPGTVMVAIIWPVLIPMVLYFTFKMKVLKLPIRMDWVCDVELLGCVGVTAAGFYLYLQSMLP